MTPTLTPPRAPTRAVGIDLGTTNSALAWIDRGAGSRRIEVMPVPQLVQPGEVGARATLPSLLYRPGEHDLPAGATALPWDAAARDVVGELARAQGALVPGRLVSSAKSWLCHPAVDRHAAILPWAAPAEVPRCSPVDASAAYLAHLAAAFAAATGERLVDAELVLTVPASFDEAARELTVEAAQQAGLTKLTLLEEPQAAFYSWLADHGEDPPSALADGAVVLVCDIGGGTTDLTVIQVESSAASRSAVAPAGRPEDPPRESAAGQPAASAARLIFRRTAVGDHLLLGGDNMDLALARRVERRLVPGGKLDAARLQTLIQLCRTAKERLLGEESRDSWTIRLPGRGRGIIGGALQSELTRAEVEETVLDGFFPAVPLDVEPQRQGSAVGLREFGLPYEHEPRVTAHLAAFLRRHEVKPDAVLFNGGVLTSPAIRERLLDALASWCGGRPIALRNDAPDLAVARGAAWYGLVRAGEAQRIAAGAARAYYVELAASTDRPPGLVTVLCVSARGEAEGGEIEVAGREFELITNRPARFRLFSASDRHDRAGELLTLRDGELHELPPIVTVLRFARSSQDVVVKVRLHVQRSELGTLDLHLVGVDDRQRSGDPARWRLAFDLRAAEQAPAPAATDSTPTVPPSAIDEARIAAAVDVLRAVFDKSHPRALAPAQAMKELQGALGVDKAHWPLAALRRLWEPLKELRGQRGRTAEHEARWLNLVGYSLRPGYGVALDDWRLKEAWRLFNSGLVHDKDNRCRLEWWILWRRISGGLTRTMQDELGKRIFPHFLPSPGEHAKKKSDRRTPSPQEAAEMWRVAASLERVNRDDKARLAEVLLAKIEQDKGWDAAAVWSLGRLGARVPLHGSIDRVISRHKAEKWLERLLALDLRSRDLAFATAEIARASGDRGRDIDDALRQRVASRLLASPDGARLAKLVTEPVQLDAAEERFAFGDALPVGLRLTSTEGRGDDEPGEP